MKRATSRLALVALLTSGVLPASQASIYLHSDLPEDQRRSIEYDLATLDRLVPIDDADTAEAAKKMGITGKVDATSLRAWLEERVRYIVPQDWTFADKIKPGKDIVSYPHADAFPVIEKATKTPSNGKGEASGVTIAMANIGAALYMGGKQMMRVLTLEIDRKHKEKILSPRIGLIQVGQGLFATKFRADQETADTPANSLLRLATFFHESHHSDGNGTSLAFVHAVCAEGTYAGYSACDRNRNGPYTIGAEVLRLLMKQCDQCGVAAKEALRAQMADSFSRVIQKTPGPSTDIQTTLLEAKVLLCDLKEKFGEPVDPTCPADRKALADAKNASPLVDTTDWDATPEALAR